MPSRLDSEPVPRRDFLGLAGYWSACLFIVGSIVGMARLPKPRVLPEASSRFRAGMPADFPPGTTKIITEHSVRISATQEGVAAMSMVCTHLGCIVRETSTGFSCPCHGSKFDQDGKVTGGPAPRPLLWFAVSQAADGSLEVDTSMEAAPGQYYRA